MHNKGSRRRREREHQKCVWINYGWKVPKLKEGNRYPDTGSTEDPKQDETKQTHYKTYLKWQKLKRILKAAREKQRVVYNGTPKRLSADFSAETLQARKEWHDIFKVLKGKNLQSRILYPAKLSFRIEGKIKNVLDKQKLKEFSNTKLKEMLKGLL